MERLFGTFMHTRAVLLDGFTGHNVGMAAKIRAKAKKLTGRAEILASMTTEELQVHLDQWVDGTYHLNVHGTLRMSPMAKWLASPIPAAAAPTRDQLEIALTALVDQRTVGKRGLTWKGGRYFCPELAAWIGRHVIVRRDENDLGELLAFDAQEGADMSPTRTRGVKCPVGPVTIDRARNARDGFDCNDAGISIGRTEINGIRYFVVSLKAPDGAMFAALLDVDSFDMFAGILSKEIEAENAEMLLDRLP